MCREPDGSYQLVRVEVVLQGATLFVVLTDAECAPPPLRIDNYSPVSIIYHQVLTTPSGAGGGGVIAKCDLQMIWYFDYRTNWSYGYS